jgi:GTPase SAR1 family protein
VGSQNKLWKHYYDRVDGIIFVVDSTDFDRIDDVNNELANIILEPSLKDVPILVLCNKTDISEDAKVETNLFEKLKSLKSTNDNFEI